MASVASSVKRPEVTNNQTDFTPTGLLMKAITRFDSMMSAMTMFHQLSFAKATIL